MTTLKRTIRSFLDHNSTDLAAGLTYYAVLAVFPAMLALLSILGVVGDAGASLTFVLDVLRPLVSDSTLESVKPTLESMARAKSAGLTLIAGVLLAVWSASGYVGAFSRAMNNVRGVEEDRPIWKLRPFLFAITLLEIVLCAVALVIVVATGDVAESIGNEIGLGDQAVLVWEIAKWPALALIVLLIVTLLQRATPNCRRLKFEWISLGAFVSIVLWLVASVGFAFYVANFGSYNKTYGAVAGVVVALLWLWLTNLALLLGGELDAQIDANRAAEQEPESEDVPQP